MEVSALTLEIRDKAPVDLVLPHLLACDLIDLPLRMHDEVFLTAREELQEFWSLWEKRVEAFTDWPAKTA